ncbi:MAG TPA: KTSC domain-containing protein [Cyanobacteria bacterium UBA11049]|nr:KTSC domain-containing protein [Cyanobacteria bacterium UBA11049]
MLLNAIPPIPVDSSNVKAISYAADARVLQVDFLTGSRYRYFAVDRLVFDRFIIASSIGRFLNREIETVYEYCRID